MKAFLRFAKLFSAFFLMLAATFFFVVDYRSHELTGRGDVSDRVGLICICMAAIGLAILWQIGEQRGTVKLCKSS